VGPTARSSLVKDFAAARSHLRWGQLPLACNHCDRTPYGRGRESRDPTLAPEKRRKDGAPGTRPFPRFQGCRQETRIGDFALIVTLVYAI
jgi:hypothetical protein